MANQDYEKLGVFYLGRRYQATQDKASRELLLYESRNLVTHALVVGMTGSGKTGLCFDLIEEAAMDGIPSVLIDPKGDLSNLLLTFPDLKADDFLPWVNEDDARRNGLSSNQFAAQQAELWRKGLAEWDQDGERIRRLKAAAEFAIYTPGSTAGLPVSIVSSFATPPAEVLEDPEMLRERVTSTVVGLLGLVGLNADPLKSRECILLSNLVQQAWAKGRSLDLASLIEEIQKPSITRIGVLDLDSFFPAKDRFELSMQLNNLLASPSFGAWMQGEPLDMTQLLHTPQGKPRVAIFSIAHLGDSERMFFVTLVLNQMLSWMRSQSGTNSLRALMYMDEIFGYFPPVANPPSKVPLLTLLKQGRAFGVGVVLATQNPVDLDYKGLANIGTWCIGRLQTDRDKARVLDGLEGAAQGQGAPFDRSHMEQILAGLGSRVFLLHSVHEEHYELFQSRWAMSYLRGPLSRTQIKALMSSYRSAPASPKQVDVQVQPGGIDSAGVGSSQAQKRTSSLETAKPVLPPQIPQFFSRTRSVSPPEQTFVYQARLLGVAQVRFVDAKLKVDTSQDVIAATDITDNALPVDWAVSQELLIKTSELEKTPTEADYAALASSASQPKNYEKWGKDFSSWLFSTRKLGIFRSAVLGITSQPGEEERDFRIRLQQTARERRDAAAEKLRQQYSPKFAALQDRLRRAEAKKQRESEQANRAKLDTVVSFGSTLLGAFLGRKTLSVGNLGRAASTIRGVGRAVEQSEDVTRAAETVEAIQQQIAELDEQFAQETATLKNTMDPTTETLENIQLSPSKTNIQVRLVALLWLPYTKDAVGILSPAY